jgi:ArsR family transcriptional regulator
VSVLRLSQPKISRHLAELRVCGLVCSTRKGKWMHYALNPALPKWASDIVKQTFENNPGFIEKELIQLNACEQNQSVC